MLKDGTESPIIFVDYLDIGPLTAKDRLKFDVFHIHKEIINSAVFLKDQDT